MKRQLVSKTKTKLSVRRQCNTLKINRSELYYKPQPIKTENLQVMKLIDIKAIYPQRNLTKIAKGEYKFPYLLRNVVVTKPNQVWSVDITYIAMANGFMYLTAIIDVYSRFIVGWNVGNSLDAEVSLGVLRQAIVRYGNPEIVNSDQGSQYTSVMWVNHLCANKITISMDGRGRATDNI